jgi:transposase
MTGEMFKAYTEQFLVPTLKRGDVGFMDNVSVHKVDGIEEAIEARGAIPFYLPAYSPDLNPIEQLFAKLKALLPKVAAYTLKEPCLHRQEPYARPSPPVSIKSPELNAPRTSQIHDMVNLNGERFSVGFPAHDKCDRRPCGLEALGHQLKRKLVIPI